MHDLDRTREEEAPRYYSRRRQQNGSALNEETQMDLAANLMEMETEEEFEQFLGDVISQVADAAGKFISSPTGHALGGALKDAAKAILPVAGQAVGTYLGGPTGGQIGGALGTAVSSQFEEEMDEQEWEAANVFVKVAVDSINNAGNAPAGSNPDAVAHSAVIEAARRHAPHLVDALSAGRRDSTEGHRPTRDRHHSGRWARHGRQIIVFGA
jgi:hypothetical protein